MSWIDRSEARRRNRTYYFIGEECKNGHVADRLTSSGACTECIAERNEQFLEDKGEYIVAKKEKRLKKVKAKLAKEREIQMYLDDPDYRVYKDEDQYEDIEFLPKTQEEARVLGSTSYYPGKPCIRGHNSPRKTTSGICRVCSAADTRKYRLLNPERLRALRQRRRARKFQVGGSHTGEDIKRLYKEQSGKCTSCKCDLSITGYHVDHIMPLYLLGTNNKENLQLLCPNCNLSKGALHPDAWNEKLEKQRLEYEE